MFQTYTKKSFRILSCNGSKVYLCYKLEMLNVSHVAIYNGKFSDKLDNCSQKITLYYFSIIFFETLK